MYVSRLQPFEPSLLAHLTLTILPTPQSLPCGGHAVAMPFPQGSMTEWLSLHS